MIEDFSPEEIEDLRATLTAGEPLGPTDAKRLGHAPLAARRLLQKDNEIYQELMKKRGIIVGRRGSGKTSFMEHLRASADYRYVVMCNAANVFPQILSSVRSLFGEYPPLVETTGHLWSVLIWCATFGVMLRQDNGYNAKLQPIQDFANRIPFDPQDEPERIIKKVIERLQRRVNQDVGSLTNQLGINDALQFNDNASFEKALLQAKSILGKGRRRSALSPALVLMDTLENYGREVTEATDAVAGLLHFLGNQDDNAGLLDVRFCLPTELYSQWKNLSTNPMKDFNSQTLLHWHAGDLLRAIAHRSALQMQLYDKDRYNTLIGHHKIDTRSGAGQFCASLLPKAICNSSGVSEPTIAFILRHTQLLPRHAIDIFNYALSFGIDRDSRRFGDVGEDHIKSAVKLAEVRITRDIASAFSHKYPHLEDICIEVLPNLPARFDESKLHIAFNRFGGKAKGMEFSDFKRMLFEVGIVGKETGKITDMYYEVEFEYTVASRLVTAKDDWLRIHPLFSGTYPPAPTADRNGQPVFPRGSDPGSNDG